MKLRSLTLSLSLAASFSPVMARAAQAQTVISHDKGCIVVALGNSITYHPQSRDLHWPGNWGMAATSLNKDYVSRLSEQIGTKFTTPTTSIRISVKDWGGPPYSFQLNQVQQEDASRADILVIGLGDNVPPNQDSANEFGRELDRFLKTLRRMNSNAELLCLGTWWTKSSLDLQIEKSCKISKGHYVGLSGLSQRAGMTAVRDWPDAAAGVQAHPGDLGMLEIARRIVMSLNEAKSEMSCGYRK